MLKYDLSRYDNAYANDPLYVRLARAIRHDIRSGRLTSDTKLPSKRRFAKELGVSNITVEAAYEQLMSEGFIYSLPKKGYYVADLGNLPQKSPEEQVTITQPTSTPTTDYIDLSNNRVETKNFPFTQWKRLYKDALNGDIDKLMARSPTAGVYELRKAIADHLAAFRDIHVDPSQIIVGAGTEYIYSLVSTLLGHHNIFCTESPGPRKIIRSYRNANIYCRLAEMDEDGVTIEGLRKCHANIAHVSPTHHFPTGITMSITRRYELLQWANNAHDRYIIEDDYDSEFRLHGRPIPAMQSLDTNGKVIYLNTFAKSLAPAMTVSYMVLPPALLKAFYEQFHDLECTVPNFEQHILARFISEGHFEKHISRMRLYYARQRLYTLEAIRKSSLRTRAQVIEHDSGLHFLLQLDTERSDTELREMLLARGIHIVALSDYFYDGEARSMHQFSINCTNIDTDRLPEVLEEISQCL